MGDVQGLEALFVQLGPPIGGALSLAVALVKGATILERDASQNAIQFAADILLRGNLADLGKLVQKLVPVIFDRVYGSQPWQFKFISRSVLSTATFWMILLYLKHANFFDFWSDIADDRLEAISILLSWFVLDWISLVKARMLIKFSSSRPGIISGLAFFVCDFVSSYCLCLLSAIAVLNVLKILTHDIGDYDTTDVFQQFLHFGPVVGYFTSDGHDLDPGDIIVTSTLMTSAWTLFLVLTCVFVRILVPVDRLRRFTTWFFKDVESHPFVAIAKMSAFVIVTGAFVVKAMTFI